MAGKDIELMSASEEDSGMEDMLDLEDGPIPMSYVKTVHEVDPEQVEKVGPKFEQVKLDDLDEIKTFGSVCQYIKEGQGVVLVMPSEPESIFDLDNIVCLPEDASDPNTSKVVVGFIADVVGPVSMPLYCCALYKSFVEHLGKVGVTDLKAFLLGKELCLVQKCLKTINAELPEIMKKKGCDASNAYDEELSDKEFSDDEEEARVKKAAKNKRKMNKMANNLEEGEIMEDQPRPKK